MLKKTFSLLIAIFLIFITTNVFAMNGEFSESMNKAGNNIRNVVGGAENVVENAASDIGAGVQNIGNAFTDNDMNNDNMDNGSLENGGYAATRTATPRTTANTNSGIGTNAWTWIILAIAAILIVGLVWYYAKQNKNEYNNNH